MVALGSDHCKASRVGALASPFEAKGDASELSEIAGACGWGRGGKWTQPIEPDLQRSLPRPDQRGQPIPYPGVSPIHTSPPSKYSFFQIGTTSFNRSMKYSADSNAGLRCAALTASTILVSPMLTRPDR